MTEKEPLKDKDYLDTSYQSSIEDDDGNKRGTSMLKIPQSLRRSFVSLGNYFEDFTSVGEESIRTLGTIGGVFSPVALAQFSTNLFLRTGKWL